MLSDIAELFLSACCQGWVLIIEWMLSPDGAAMATWLAALIGVAAILIAVRALLNDQQRAHEDRVRVETDRKRVFGEYCSEASRVVGHAAVALSKGETGYREGSPLLSSITALNDMVATLELDLEVVVAMRDAAPASFFVIQCLTDARRMIVALLGIKSYLPGMAANAVTERLSADAKALFVISNALSKAALSYGIDHA